jgi:hypothetical protein
MSASNWQQSRASRPRLYQEINHKIIRQIEPGTVPWVQPWAGSVLSSRSTLAPSAATPPPPRAALAYFQVAFAILSDPPITLREIADAAIIRTTGRDGTGTDRPYL